MSEQMQPEWLVRDTNNSIRGPYTHSEVSQLIKKGQLKGKIEVCRAKAYWFRIEERDELEKFFPELIEIDTKKIRQEPTGPIESQPEDDEESTQVIAVTPSVPTYTRQAKAPIAQPATNSKNTEKNRLKMIGIIFAIVVFALILIRLQEPKTAKNSTVKQSVAKTAKLSPQQRLLRAFLLRDTEELRRLLSDKEKEAPGTPAVEIAQAFFRRWYLFDLDGAITALESALPKATAEKPIMENLLGVLYSERDLNKADNYLESAAKTGAAIPAYNLAVVEIRSGNLPKAEATLLEAEKKLSPGQTSYSDLALADLWLADKKGAAVTSISYKISARDLTDARFRAIRGLINLRRKQFAEAGDEFRAFVELLPEFDPGMTKDMRVIGDEAFYEYVWKEAQSLLALNTSQNTRLAPEIVAAIGILTAMQNRTDEASKLLDNALNVSPGNPALLKGLAYVRWRQDRFRDILDLLQSLPPEAQTNFSIIYLLARVNAKLGNDAKAAEYFSQVVKRLPGRADGWSGYGTALLALGKKSEASKAFETALKLDRFDAAALRGFEQLGDWIFLENPEYKELLPIF